jgi:hypothetical protein
MSGSILTIQPILLQPTVYFADLSFGAYVSDAGESESWSVIRYHRIERGIT